MNVYLTIYVWVFNECLINYIAMYGYLFVCYVVRLVKLQQSGVQLSERLASLGSLGAQLRTLVKPFKHHNNMLLRGLKGAFNWTPIM